MGSERGAPFKTQAPNRRSPIPCLQAKPSPTTKATSGEARQQKMPGSLPMLGSSQEDGGASRARSHSGQMWWARTQAVSFGSHCYGHADGDNKQKSQARLAACCHVPAGTGSREGTLGTSGRGLAATQALNAPCDNRGRTAKGRTALA